MRLGDIAKKSSLKLKMISEEELVDLHKVLLLMLDDLIEICKRNNLHFILIGGSAIGALESRKMYDGKLNSLYTTKINWDIVTKKLQPEIEKSKKFLQVNL